MRSSTLSPLDDVDAAGAGDGLDRRGGHEQRRRRRRLLEERRGEEPGLQPAVGVRRDASTVSARWSALSDGDTKRTFAANVSPG